MRVEGIALWRRPTRGILCGGHASNRKYGRVALVPDKVRELFNVCVHYVTQVCQCDHWESYHCYHKIHEFWIAHTTMCSLGRPNKSSYMPRR